MEDLLAWMKVNQDLSGWAQTIGALLALLVALAVPWVQHASQARRDKLIELEGNIYLSLATMLLLRDALSLSTRVRQLAHMPKHEVNDPVLVIDLLERLRTLDAKDSSVPRQASQYIARAAVLRINHYIDSGQAQSRELSPPVLEIMQTDSSHMETEHSKLNFLLDDLLYQQTKLQVSMWKRPWVWYGFKTKTGRKWLNATSEKRAQQLRKEIQSQAA
ncbi:hypothetical protein N0K08_09310 [Acidovorax sp. Be4]|uniref:DUF4760 domain-containing protein n=1 Tax=Acidovorax bellezanensis TaxID=2976702 RepID=A0ABT2PNP6_9BURK|nr:hypothetical protein [Acidovorax sp. Be4]MCT9810832.1 hypothetical protein [Acidovorax sp. Be4]